MLAHFYIVIDDKNPELHHDLDDESMQEFVIQQAAMEGVLYHTEMLKIKILYNTHNGEVRLVDADERIGINFDYSNAFQTQRKLVELAIRRLVKMDLLNELDQMKDSSISEIIRQHHEVDASGKIISNTSEIALDMTLVKIFKLGYFDVNQGFSLTRWISGISRKKQTHIQRAVYAAFEDFKKQSENSSRVLDEFKSKTAVQQFKEFINKYL